MDEADHDHAGDLAGPLPGDGFCLLIVGRTALVKEDGAAGVTLPRTRDLCGLHTSAEDRVCIGRIAGAPCWAVGFAELAEPPAGLTLCDLRLLLERLPPEHAAMASSAAQLLHWRRIHRRCGSCGTALGEVAGEQSRRCPSCGLTIFPRPSPAIIVAVLKEGRILLAHSPRFPSGLYSVLAGFVEPGETLEACIHREVREEVGIEIANLRYFGSQAWPFPDSLMIGFLADHAGGEIRADGVEIQDARWFGPHALPQVPNRTSISGQLIAWFVTEQDGKG